MSTGKGVRTGGGAALRRPKEAGQGLGVQARGPAWRSCRPAASLPLPSSAAGLAALLHCQPLAAPALCEAAVSPFFPASPGEQVQSVRHLLAGRSVVVCAPTGAGKTAIAEAATIDFLARRQRVIYTTPLKALSNQKLGEMRERFG